MERKLLELDQLDTNLKEYLNSIYTIFNDKNIKYGLNTRIVGNKIYICFAKDYLSYSNKVILSSLSYVYCLVMTFKTLIGIS